MAQARLVGVDIGGTKTHIRASLHAGGMVESIVPTALWRPVEQERDPERLLDVLGRVCEIDASTFITLGVHGCDTRAQCLDFARRLGDVGAGSFTVVNDAELLVPAAGFTSGIGLVVGTGSIAVGQDYAGELATSGGWGWLLGDPASAPALVRDAAGRLLAASDSGPVEDVLRTELFGAYDVGTERELAYVLTARADIHFWAGAAPAVFRAADLGSALARDVLDTQLDALVDEVGDLVRRGVGDGVVVVGGGVAVGQPAYARRLCERLSQRLGVHAVVFDRAPVEGALALAARSAADPSGAMPAERAAP